MSVIPKPGEIWSTCFSCKSSFLPLWVLVLGKTQLIIDWNIETIVVMYLSNYKDGNYEINAGEIGNMTIDSFRKKI